MKAIGKIVDTRERPSIPNSIFYTVEVDRQELVERHFEPVLTSPRIRENTKLRGCALHRLDETRR